MQTAMETITIMSQLFLTAEEVAELTGYKTRPKQIATLKRMGIAFVVNRNNRPIVARAIFTHATQMQTTAAPPPTRTWQSNKAKNKTI